MTRRGHGCATAHSLEPIKGIGIGQYQKFGVMKGPRTSNTSFALGFFSLWFIFQKVAKLPISHFFNKVSIYEIAYLCF